MLARSILAILIWAFAACAFAQEQWPTRAVKFVVPFPAGGPLDLVVRLTAQQLTELWGQPVIAENHPGATGSIGAGMVARAEPDGYTLLYSVDIPLTMYPAVASKMAYDPLKDLKPIANVATTANALFVNANVPAKTTDELVALAKKKPGKLTFSSAGIGSPAHFGGELFKSIAEVDMLHVPYKGAAPAMQAAVSGEVDLMFGPITQGLPHVRSGKMRVLGVTGPEASPLLPGVKPLQEQGYKGLVVFNWYPVMAPAGTPDAIVRKVGEGLKKVLSSPEIQEKLKAVGIDPEFEGPAEVRKRIAADMERWKKLADRAGIKSPN